MRAWLQGSAQEQGLQCRDLCVERVRNYLGVFIGEVGCRVSGRGTSPALVVMYARHVHYGGGVLVGAFPGRELELSVKIKCKMLAT